jgi:hypothetical protein
LPSSYKSFVEAFRDGGIASLANKALAYLQEHPKAAQEIEEVLAEHGVKDFEEAFASAGFSVTWRTPRDQLVRAALRSEAKHALEAATVLQPVKGGTFHIGDLRVEVLPWSRDVIGMMNRTAEEAKYVESEMKRMTKVMQEHGYNNIDIHPMSVNNAFLPDDTLVAIDRGVAEIPAGTTPTPITEAPWVKV